MGEGEHLRELELNRARTAVATRRRAARNGWAVFFALGITGSVAANVCVELAAPGPLDRGRYSVVLVVAAFVLLVGIQGAGVILGYRTWLRGVRGYRVLLWLRRFGDRRSRILGRAIRKGSVTLAQPITLQDGTVPYSYEAVSVRLIGWLPIAIIAAKLTLIVLLLGAVALIAATNGSSAWILGLPALLAGYGILAVWLIRVFVRSIGRRFGARCLAGRDVVEAMQRFTHRVRDTTFVVGGLEVVQVNDEDWQVAVDAAIRLADIVVLDVSELTESIQWELDRVARHVDPACVILASASAQWEEPPVKGDQLPGIAGVPSDWLRACRRFTYPAELPSWLRRWRIHRQLARRMMELEAEIMEALARPRAVRMRTAARPDGRTRDARRPG